MKNSMSRGLVVQTERTRKYRSSIGRGDPIWGERNYHRDCPIEDVATRSATKIVTKKAPTESLL
ncbi:unnamed protein product [Hymenolepis diminuta]|uniref:Uncharacterized protein n=1 Tax=Hymenolepis diminuta TaxID=6216 RepID=A0A564Z1U8_HYMDI|nr:unnamed protein product [Hymenolepis diminuta]